MNNKPFMKRNVKFQKLEINKNVKESDKDLIVSSEDEKEDKLSDEDTITVEDGDEESDIQIYDIDFKSIIEDNEKFTRENEFLKKDLKTSFIKIELLEKELKEFKDKYLKN